MLNFCCVFALLYLMALIKLYHTQDLPNPTYMLYVTSSTLLIIRCPLEPDAFRRSESNIASNFAFSKASVSELPDTLVEEAWPVRF